MRKKELTDHGDFHKLLAIMDKHLGKSLDNKVDKVGKENYVGPFESKDEEQRNNETFD